MAGESTLTDYVSGREQSTSPFRPHHVGKLTSPNQFVPWEMRTRSYIMSFEGYGKQLINPGNDIDDAKQDHIFHLLIQIVHDQEGFAKLRAIEGTITSGTRSPSRRGHQAWEALRNHYLQVGTVRLRTL